MPGWGWWRCSTRRLDQQAGSEMYLLGAQLLGSEELVVDQSPARHRGANVRAACISSIPHALERIPFAGEIVDQAVSPDA